MVGVVQPSLLLWIVDIGWWTWESDLTALMVSYLTTTTTTTTKRLLSIPTRPIAIISLVIYHVTSNKTMKMRTRSCNMGIAGKRGLTAPWRGKRTRSILTQVSDRPCLSGPQFRSYLPRLGPKGRVKRNSANISLATFYQTPVTLSLSYSTFFSFFLAPGHGHHWGVTTDQTSLSQLTKSCI